MVDRRWKNRPGVYYFAGSGGEASINSQIDSMVNHKNKKPPNTTQLTLAQSIDNIKILQDETFDDYIATDKVSGVKINQKLDKGFTQLAHGESQANNHKKKQAQTQQIEYIIDRDHEI